MRRVAVLLGFVLFLLLPTSVAAAECQFVLGFNTLRDLIGNEVVGECLENEHHNEIGDSVQQTTGGLLVWRKADNWTAFTDGYRTWLNGPNGLVQRLNTERFEWEADYAPGGGVATPTPTPIPSATPLPSLIELAKASAWYQDGVDYADKYYVEPIALRALEKIDRSNLQLARMMSNWAWVFDEDMQGAEANVIEYIAELDEKVPEFVPYIADLPWIADGVNRWESSAASHLYGMAVYGDPDFAVELATAPWVMDGITLVEEYFGMNALTQLFGHIQIAHSSPELARQVMGFVSYPPREVDLFLVDALKNIALLNPDGFERLLTEPWFVDGLDEKERIYLIAAAGSDLDANELFEPYSIESTTIALPHTGAVNLWVVHRRPSPPGRGELANLEKGVRGSEQFFELPLPVDNVILSFSAKGRGAHLGRVMVLPPNRADPRAVNHEAAHYYFKTGPTWFSEGGASFMSLYLANGGNIPTVEFPGNCEYGGFDNLQELNDGVNNPQQGTCFYSMGLHFLVALRETMGHEAWRSALRAFYLEFEHEGLFVSTQDQPEDEDVYRVFMEHTPPHLVAAVKDVFRRLHGGPFIDR